MTTTITKTTDALLEELLKEVREQKIQINKLIETVNAQRKLKILPPFDKESSLTFQMLSVKGIVKFTTSDLLRFKDSSFIKVSAELLTNALRPTGTMTIIDKMRKVFYLKMTYSWCSNMEYNNLKLDQFIDNFIVYVLQTVYESSELSVIESNQVNNAVLKGKNKIDVLKKIRYKIVNSF
jgi:hypothetical protein